MKKAFTIAAATVLLAGNANAQFTAGNIAVLEAAASANNTTASIVELTKTDTAQAAVATYPINGTMGTNALRFSGSASSTMYLTNSNTRSLLCFTGVNTTTATGNINTVLSRGVGTFGPAGTYNLATTYTGASGNQTRSATTLNDTAFYIADQNGLYTNGATSASVSGSFRNAKAFGGTVYISLSSSTSTNIQVNTVALPTATVITGLPGLANNGDLQDFHLISSANNGTFDVLYVVSSTGNTAGTISKYSLVSGTWTANGTYTTTFGGYGMTAERTTTGANLYVSTGAGSLVGNSVLKITDAAGYNATLNITTANNVTLYTAGTAAIVKGVAFAPVNPPTLTVAPTTIAGTFSTSVNTFSAADSFTVTATNLDGNVAVTAPASFQVATALAGPYSTTVALLPMAAGGLTNAKVYVRFAPTATGTVTGNVTVSATGTPLKTVSVTGATPGPVVLTSTTAIANPFITLANTTSASDSFSVSGNDLTGNVTVTAPASFEVATTLGGTYAASILFVPVAGTLPSTKVYVRFVPTAPGAVTGNIAVTAASATAQNISVTGNTPTPVVNNSANSISTTFIASLNGTSAPDTFSVNAVALNAPLVVTAPANFEVAKLPAGPYSSSISFTPIVGTVINSVVYVRFKPAAAGTFTDTVRATSTGAVTRKIVVTGFTSSATNPASFTLSAGNYLMNGWDSTQPAGTYPPNMIFHTTTVAVPLLTTAQLVGNWTCGYNLTTRPRVNGLGANGFSMINTGSPQYDDCQGGATLKNTFMGASVLALNTTAVEGLTLKYTAGLVKQGDGAIPRAYKLRLQYRLDSVSAYQDLMPALEYTSAGKTDGDAQNFTAQLPAAFEGKAFVGLRWLYYADTTGGGGSGSRPEIRLNEISVVSKTVGLNALAGGNNTITLFPNPVAAGGTIRFSQVLSGRLYDALGRVVSEFKNAAELQTGTLATGVYTLRVTGGGYFPISVQ